MASIDIETLLTIIYVLVDDWYKREARRLFKGKAGCKPVFTDSEVMTLMLAMDFIPFPSESQFLGFMRANYLGLFPKLIVQSEFNRRARGLRLLVIEGAFNEIQNTGRHLERLLAKTGVGLSTRVIAKFASHTLKLLLRRDFGIDVQKFVFSPA